MAPTLLFRIVVAAMVATGFLLAGCGGGDPADTPVESPPATTGVEPSEPAAAVPERECSVGGVPDDGDAEDCDFRVDGCCYPDATHACQAAGCAPGACTIMESYPAQVACDSGSAEPGGE